MNLDKLWSHSQWYYIVISKVWHVVLDIKSQSEAECLIYNPRVSGLWQGVLLSSWLPAAPYMARNVLIVIGLILFGVLVFCLCCYKVHFSCVLDLETDGLPFHYSCCLNHPPTTPHSLTKSQRESVSPPVVLVKVYNSSRWLTCCISCSLSTAKTWTFPAPLAPPPSLSSSLPHAPRKGDFEHPCGMVHWHCGVLQRAPAAVQRDHATLLPPRSPGRRAAAVPQQAGHLRQQGRGRHGKPQPLSISWGAAVSCDILYVCKLHLTNVVCAVSLWATPVWSGCCPPTRPRPGPSQPSATATPTYRTCSPACPSTNTLTAPTGLTVPIGTYFWFTFRWLNSL